MRPPSPPRIFVSATSTDLGKVRQLVKEALLSIECMPAEHKNFPPDYRKLTDALRQRIAGCDAIIHIAGLRYGDEPDPAALPEGTPRRSYTQLEYDYARALRKRVYIFVCTPDFPYEAAALEPEERQKLQEAHRTLLMHAGYKYERVATPHEIEIKVRELREQFERLAAELARTQRRQLFAWTGVAAALVILSAVGGLGFRALVEGNRAVQTSQQQLEKDISKGTTEVSRLGDYLQRADVLADAAKAAGVDRGTIEGLLKQAEAAGAEPLAYATRLADGGRHADALSLALVIGEASVRGDRADFCTAVRAFETAGRQQREQALKAATRADAAAGLLAAAELFRRAVDVRGALMATCPEAPAAFDLVATRAGCLREAANQLDVARLRDARDLHREALATAEGAVALVGDDPAAKARAAALIARYRSGSAWFLPEAEAKAALARAVAEFDAALPVLESAGLHGEWLRTVGFRTWSVRKLLELGTEAEGHRLLALARPLVTKALEREAAPQSAEDLDRAELNFAGALLWLAEHPRSSRDRPESLAEAEQRFQRVHDRHASGWPTAKVQAAFGLIDCACETRKLKVAEKYIKRLEAAGQLVGPDAILCLTRYAVSNSIENSGLFGSAEQVRITLEDVNKELAKYTFDVAPGTHVELRFAAAALWNQRSYAPQVDFAKKGNDHLLESTASIRSALEELGRVEAACPPDAAPMEWAKARSAAGEYRLRFRLRLDTRDVFHAMVALQVTDYEHTAAEFRDALRVYDRERDPWCWAFTQYGLGCAARTSGRDDEAIPPLKESLAVWDDRYPKNAVLVWEQLAKAYTRITVKRKDAAGRREAWREAARSALMARHWSRAAGYDQTTRFDNLLADLRETTSQVLTAEERGQLTEDIEAIRREVEMTAAPEQQRKEK